MLTITEITKTFGPTTALQNITFDVAQGEIVALLGPSGCGKSTLLSLIAGLDQPDKGGIAWAGDRLDGIPPHQRGFGLMFQDYALFPHLNVFENVAFGLRMQHLEKAQVDVRVNEVLTLVGLPNASTRSVHTLSGGEQQRVALARSLAPRPSLLMLDEPLGSLDRNLRERLTGELGIILRQMQQTALYVTHDLQEAFTIADRIVLMHAGRIEQIGTPQQLYSQPETRFVANFLGLTNLIDGRVSNWKVITPLGEFPAPGQPDGPVVVLLHPDKVDLTHGDYHFEARVIETVFQGSSYQVMVETRGLQLKFNLRGNIPPLDQVVRLYFQPQDAIQFLPNEELSSYLNH